jgi:aminopeptidase N
MGINEVKYSWMDEGWAFFLTLKFFQDFYKGTKNENEELDRLIQYYSLFAGHQFESPLIAPSNHLPEGMPHTQLSYLKPAILYLTLEDMLGKEHFSTCLKTYINRWAGKHPTPYDFMFTFNDVSGQDLSWFWRAWIFEYGYPDLALKEVKDSNIYIQNYGRLPVPINLRLSYKNGEEIIIHKTAAIWEKSEPIVSIPIEHTENLQKAELLSNTFPDIVKSNNVLDLNLK